MTTSYRDKVMLLRQYIPIGMRHGLTLLNQTAGDIDQAVAMFKQEMLALAMLKTGIDEQAAMLHLQSTGFDIALTLKSIEAEQYSLTERVVRKYKNKREAIRMVAYLTAESRHVTRDFWLDSEKLRQLPPALYCVLALNEWLNYADYEGLGSAVYFKLDVITSLLNKQLSLPQVSAALQQLRRSELAQAAQRRVELETNGAYVPTNEFSAAAQLVEEQEELLVEVLHAFILKHIQLFP